MKVFSVLLSIGLFLCPPFARAEIPNLVCQAEYIVGEEENEIDGKEYVKAPKKDDEHEYFAKIHAQEDRENGLPGFTALYSAKNKTAEIVLEVSSENTEIETVSVSHISETIKAVHYLNDFKMSDKNTSETRVTCELRKPEKK